MSKAEEFIKQKLTERQQAGIYRSLKTGSGLIDFCSNDYLGYAGSSALKAKINTEIRKYPDYKNGSAGSRLLAGNLIYTEQLEKQIAVWHYSEAGLLFNSGYDANVGLFSSLPQRGDTIILDELAHASIIDGARLSYANRYTFKHNDIKSLEEKLKAAKGNVYIGIESVYSMDGDTPPIANILDISEKYGAHVFVDEAHAIGLYKKGLVPQLGLQSRVFARVVTFGKGLGCHGAIVLGSNLLRDYLVNFARSFIYTTAASFHQLAAIRCAYAMLTEETQAIDQLKQNIDLFKSKVDNSTTYPLLPSESAIQCLVLKSNEKAKQAATLLQQAGFDVRPILSPTVPQGSERLRICLHNYNTEQEITRLTNVLNRLTHTND
ncbi:8-amino-7-oxononanoate synthase [Mucilaginibacter limnophilus]|uniref:8-amino-7-oxononanoate synthase n=1 Tax=Mucilaginibacter limnophilus TaxID=1932778 RepID=A0A3S3TGP5_9SPHI|nr:8-amino-7-oxononanoate synthase [Mucilaginibacter limnophilus]RVU00626.1 8-amino-7-oxononanoate synthase [Mucilaginibacter limnophilus]